MTPQFFCIIIKINCATFKHSKFLPVMMHLVNIYLAPAVPSHWARQHGTCKENTISAVKIRREFIIIHPRKTETIVCQIKGIYCMGTDYTGDGWTGSHQGMVKQSRKKSQQALLPSLGGKMRKLCSRNPRAWTTHQKMELSNESWSLKGDTAPLETSAKAEGWGKDLVSHAGISQ